MSLNAAVRRADIRRSHKVDESVVGAESGVSKAFTGYLPMILAALIVVLPLLWMVLGSFKTPSEILHFPGRKIIFILVLVALMVPAQVSLVPNYVLISQLGGVNTYWGIILPGLGTAFGTFLLRQHFLSLPGEVMEAAEVDGAGHMTRLFRMVIPMSAPAIATVALVTIVDEWNNYIWPLVITSDTSRMVLPVGLTALQAVDSDAGVYPILMAGAVFVILPVLLIFVLLQRYLVAGLTQGAVK